MWCSSNLLHRFPHGDGPSVTLLLSPRHLICATFNCPFPSHVTLNGLSLRLMSCFSLSFCLPLQLFLTLSSAAVLSVKEKTAIVEELGRASCCVNRESKQSPSPATAHIYTTLSRKRVIRAEWTKWNLRQTTTRLTQVLSDWGRRPQLGVYKYCSHGFESDVCLFLKHSSGSMG